MVTRAARAITSRGSGYEPQPVNHAALNTCNLSRGYYLDLSSKAKAASADIPESLEPASLAQLGLGLLEQATAQPVDTTSLARAGAIADMLEARSQVVDGGLLLPYRVKVPKYGLTPPWFSAMAQGQAASLLARLGIATGDERRMDVALAFAKPLMESAPGLVVSTADGPVLEEAPTRRPSRILNGWIYSLWGLRDVGLATEREQALSAYRDGVACLRRTIRDYDMGWWSRYSLYPLVRNDIAKPFYHQIHVRQLYVMWRLEGAVEFRDIGSRWAAADTMLGRGRAVATLGWDWACAR